ncbi:iron-containing redox enzyme family protein [Myxococcaceae bacterium GXIMD 01537]
MDAFIARLKQRHAPLDNPYLRSLRDGELSREDFIETQLQFLFAVVFFSRPMAVLAGRLPRPEMRLALLENVHDEHGSGNVGMMHERTFLTLLSRFGVSQEDVERRALWPEVRAFNTVLAGLCTLDDVSTGLAALGIIEDFFSGISAHIGQSIVKRGWLAPEAVAHYPTHESLDVEHAEGFYRVIRPLHGADARHAYHIEQGLELGAYAFLRLYEDLHRARARRAQRTVKGPHSLADGWYLPTP